jgi:Asp-tRNA(Asn)/Glu-tRNA(Gln) amidotransferase A subunit family amidase
MTNAGMPDTPTLAARLERRAFMSYFAGIGLASTAVPSVLWAAVAQGAELTKDTIKGAEDAAGLKFTDEQREMMLNGLKLQTRLVAELRKVPLANSVPPSVLFNPLPPGTDLVTKFHRLSAPPRREAPVRTRVTRRTRPAHLDELAFLGVNQLAELLRTRQITSTELTRMCLDRFRRYDPVLKTVITLTEERALRQAAAADDEITRGRYRGPLHGIPWGAKDLLATKGYPTTWGAGPFRTQTIEEDATVVRRLDAAGAVLVAKLSLGELAMGDVWFGHGPTDATDQEKTRKGWRTRNPWNVDQGSSGSSAGPCAAVAAGLVPFAIGSETLGSIASPATRNGVTGLRPTFGRIPRTGAMALSWSMDKLGPIARSAEDCALVFDALHGPDHHDLTVVEAPFRWDATRDPKRVRVGYVKSGFEPAADSTPTPHGMPLFGRFDRAALDVLRTLGVSLTPIDLPDMPYGPMRLMLNAEAAAAFDELTRSGRDAELVQQGPNDWANSFRVARLISAVDYINASRLRTLVIQRWNELFRTVDVIVSPTFGNSQLLATNLTGHPAVILPHGFRDTSDTDKRQVPVSLTFIGGLFEEATLLAVAHAYQKATDFHLRQPESITEAQGL